ncbi:MAG TPA: hypothetical protein VFO94_14175 [Gammaproteobacteria bacterium]|nr:hypothetical protein [Gammaproteobacteria bacterium]
MPAGVTGGLVTPPTGSMRVAAEHFAAATVYLLAGAAGLVWVAPELASGMYASPHVIGVTHLFTLGWLTTTIFGALSQLLPVALGAPIRSVRTAHASFWTFAPGAGLFATGLATGVTALHHGGIALVALGIALAVWNIATSLRRARSRDVTWAAITIALAFLASTLVLGVVLMHNLHTGFIAEARLRVLAIHLHVALIGWVLVMIVGVSHRLLPMFLLAHGADTQWTARALALLATGVTILAIGLAARLAAAEWLGVVMLEGGVACFLWQAYAFLRARVRPRLDVGMRFAAAALGFLIVSALLGPVVLATGAAQPRVAAAYVATGLLGGIVLYVVGFFYKIVPLLAWTVRFRGRMGKEAVPTVTEMFSARVAHAQLALMIVAVVALAAGIAMGSSTLALGAATLFFAGVLLFAGQIVRVAFGGRASR